LRRRFVINPLVGRVHIHIAAKQVAVGRILVRPAFAVSVDEKEIGHAVPHVPPADLSVGSVVGKLTRRTVLVHSGNDTARIGTWACRATAGNLRHHPLSL
jgi:hypothetical protein